jgi:hypothetical protein
MARWLPLHPDRQPIREHAGEAEREIRVLADLGKIG